MENKNMIGDLLVMKLESVIGRQARRIALLEIEIETLRGELDASKLEERTTEHKKSNTSNGGATATTV